MEAVDIHPGVHEIYAIGLSSVQVHKLTCLVSRVGNQAVGRSDDLLFTNEANRRFGCISLRKFSVLDLGHRVHGVNQWHIPAFRGEPTDLSRQPVVRMNEVVPAFGASSLGAHHAGCHCTQLAR